MEMFISANHKRTDFPVHLKIEHKITIFEDRVQNWQINAAIAMGDRDIPHRGPAVLQILMSYFEMIGKYRAGYCGTDKSKQYFLEGFVNVFPEAEQWPRDRFVSLTSGLYYRVRCGLYHTAVMGVDTGIVDLLKEPVFLARDGTVLISPPMLGGRISHHFAKYIESLRDQEQADLRRSFEARYDFDNGVTQPNTAAPSDGFVTAVTLC